MPARAGRLTQGNTLLHRPVQIRRTLVAALTLATLCLGATPAIAGPGGAFTAAAPPAPPSLRQPAHETLGEAVPDEAAAVELAHHIVEDLVAEETIAKAWTGAKPAAAERRRLTRRSPFHVWVVHMVAEGDVAGNGTDLFIVISDEGEFLQYGYDEP